MRVDLPRPVSPVGEKESQNVFLNITWLALSASPVNSKTNRGETVADESRSHALKGSSGKQKGKYNGRSVFWANYISQSNGH